MRVSRNVAIFSASLALFACANDSDNDPLPPMLGGAGKAGTNSAGKQLLGAYVAQASAFAITKVGSTYLATGKTKILSVPDVDGLFVGMAVTGTGVGASAVITAINPNGVEVTVDVASTAVGTVTLSFVFTNYLLVVFDAMHGQGAIT